MVARPTAELLAARVEQMAMGGSAFLLARRTQHPADLDEPGFAGQPREVVDRPSVRRHHFVVERRDRIALSCEEGE